jgi:hypothetical protein
MRLSLTKLMAATAFAALSISTLNSSLAKADDIRLGEPGYGGNGCPTGSASVTLSPDQKSLSILFDQYIVDVGGSSVKMLDRKACNLAIPVHVPQGYSVSVFQVDYRGFTALPLGARAQFNVEYFFAGARGPRQSRAFNGPMNANYELTDRLAAESLVWTPCGADTNLRINSNMTAQSNSRREQAMATVDSADITAGLVYHLQWRACK